ncbi:MAG TPA: phage portal protein [Salinimicrobium sp.]|nr:phage portal protein [Salinimicrobium sp.]
MSNIFTRAVAQIVAPQKRSAGSSTGWTSFFPFKLTEAGKSVNTNSALTISAFYCAVNTIANSIALLPMSVYKKDGKTRMHSADHAADYLLYREPNSYMTAFTFKFIMAVAVLMRGNAYALIVRDNSGNISAYQYLDPDQVSVVDYQGQLYYKFKGQTFSASEIIHIPGFSTDGICGKSIIEHAADNLGVSLTAQKFGSDSLTDRGISQGVLESELTVKVEKKKEISAAFSSAMSSGQKHRAPLLDEGMKYKPITLSPKDAQFIETYANGIADIARWFSMPLHKLHVSGEGGYNYLVQMSIEYLQTAVMPLGEKFKQEFERKSFTPSERKIGVYIHINYSKLLQADPKSRAQFYKDQYYLGAISANEIRELEDRNPRDGGDDFVQMSNVLNEMQLKKQLQDEN